MDDTAERKPINEPKIPDGKPLPLDPERPIITEPFIHPGPALPDAPTKTPL